MQWTRSNRCRRSRTSNTIASKPSGVKPASPHRSARLTTPTGQRVETDQLGSASGGTAPRQARSIRRRYRTAAPACHRGQQRRAGFEREFGFLAAGYHAEVEAGLPLHPAEELGAVDGASARLGGNSTHLADRAPREARCTGFERADRPVHRGRAELAGACSPSPSRTMREKLSRTRKPSPAGVATSMRQLLVPRSRAANAGPKTPARLFRSRPRHTRRTNSRAGVACASVIAGLSTEWDWGARSEWHSDECCPLFSFVSGKPRLNQRSMRHAPDSRRPRLLRPLVTAICARRSKARTSSALPSGRLAMPIESCRAGAFRQIVEKPR